MQVWRDPQSHYLRRQVSPLSDLPIQLVEVELPVGGAVAFPALLAHYASIEPDFAAGSEPQWLESLVFRGMKALPVRVRQA